MAQAQYGSLLSKRDKADFEGFQVKLRVSRATREVNYFRSVPSTTDIASVKSLDCATAAVPVLVAINFAIALAVLASAASR